MTTCPVLPQPDWGVFVYLRTPATATELLSINTLNPDTGLVWYTDI